MTRLARVCALSVTLGGCIQAVSTDAPCPCVAPATCCPALDRCVDDPGDCPAAPVSAPSVALRTIVPEVLPAAGGDLHLTLDIPVAEPTVFVGGLPCAIDAVDGARITCRAPAIRTGDAEQWVRVEGLVDAHPVRAQAAVRYQLAPFVDVTDAAGVHTTPLGSTLTVARLSDGGRDLIFARGSVARPSGLGSQFMQIGPLRWADISDGGLVDGLPSVTGFVPAHLNDDDVRDLLVVWSRAQAQNGQNARGLDGATGFETTIPFDLPKLTVDELIRVLPVTVGRDAAVLGVRTAAEPRERGLFMTINGAERLPTPFVMPDDWTATTISDLALVDANGDARADLIACSDFPWLFAQTAEGFEPAEPRLPNVFLYCRTLSVGDLDLDGHLDVVAGGAASGSRPTNVFQGLRILRGTGDGFETVPALSPTVDCSGPVWVGSALPEGVGAAALLDADLDGDLDIIVPAPSSACPGPPVLYVNQIVETGALDFVATVIETDWINGSSSAIVADDLDADGDLDLVYTGWAFGVRGRVLRNTAVESGAPGRSLAVRVFDGARRVHGAMLAADLDDPTRPDFAPGIEQLRVGITGHTALSITDGPTVLPLPPNQGALALRVTWPDGHTRVVEVPADVRLLDVDRGAE